MVRENNLEQAEKYFQEIYVYENWRDQYGPRLLIGMSYCAFFLHKEVTKAQEIMDQVTEP